MSCLLAWNSVILITTIIFPSYQFPKDLHMNVKKQNKQTQKVYYHHQINLYSSKCMEKNHSSMFSRISGTIKPAYYTI